MATTEELREQLKQRLMSKLQGQSQAPSMDMAQDNLNQARDYQAKTQLADALTKSAAMVGSVGGKVAEAGASAGAFGDQAVQEAQQGIQLAKARDDDNQKALAGLGEIEGQEFQAQLNPLKLQAMQADAAQKEQERQFAMEDRPEVLKRRAADLQATQLANQSRALSNQQMAANIKTDAEIRKEKTDPNSQTSRMYQAMAQKMFPDQDVSNIPASKLEQTIPGLQKVMSAQTAIAMGGPNKPPTEGQTTAALYATRMEDANNQIKSLKDAGYDRSSLASGIGTILPNVARSSKAQQQDQAERNFINAVLRRESGAVISDQEFANAEKQYFPRAGDAKEVLAQKEQNRLAAISGIKAAAGDRAMNLAYGQRKKEGLDQPAVEMPMLSENTKKYMNDKGELVRNGVTYVFVNGGWAPKGAAYAASK